MDNTCCILVPIYDHSLKSYEIVSWKQLIYMYGNIIPIVYVFSTNTNLYDDYLKRYNIPEHEYFFFKVNDYAINSWNGYCKDLCLSSNLYETIKSWGFAYTLIHQLDAFIFKDEIQYWVDKGYDYIGAPEIITDEVSGTLKKFMNGGLSLRNNDAMIGLTRNLPNNVSYGVHEDIYIYDHCNNLCPLSEAIKFAYSSNFMYLYELFDRQFPFGIHWINKSRQALELCYDTFYKNGLSI